ncbi:ArnT family glycosyltransferase [Xanthobacter agilis]|uniref:4-amino-4-deoxy-L-arabinose transferase-like glycosyltransferase n=1 Tax=Xanthobacter agilis TaxID=47492 RepID=A0ABU0LGB7_XANAG|nr:glycosyltransferase family 39 protein [Xanthobacter agilis]MDQ0506132.1 4-amino-4-deoxy-L-arabinose transferase-like glycosyltransferase [Xanthobacter agilis]
MAISEPTPPSGRAFDLDLPRRLPRLLDRAATRHAHACLLLVIVALFAFLPGFFSLSPIDRDEARFAQATKQMLESGNYVDIRFHVQVRYKKPVGIHWLQAASVKLGEAVVGPSARTSIAFYRLPSLIGAIGAVLLTYWTALVFVSRRGALIAGLLMASCVLLGVEARLAKTDAVLLFTIVAAFGALARAYLQPAGARMSDFKLAAIFWTAMAGGILIKGPMAPLFVGLAVLALAITERSGRFLKPLKPLPGLLWCLLLVLPWFIAIYYVTNGAFYQLAVGVDMLGKVTEGQEGHWGPPGTYLLAVWGTFWPSVVLAAMAVPFAWRARREPAVRFLLAWVVPTWIAFEIAATKLPHYVLPLYPGLAILAALALERNALAKAGSRLAGLVWLWSVMAGLLAVALGGAYLWLGSGFGVLAWPLLLVAVGLAVIAARALPRTGVEGAFLTMVVAALFLYFAVYQVLLPQMRAVWISERLAAIAAETGCPAENIASVPYQEPSLVFLVGTRINYIAPTEAADLLKKGGCALAFIDRKMQPLFEKRAAELNLKYSAIATVDGFTYNGGRPVSITVYRSQEPAQ